MRQPFEFHLGDLRAGRGEPRAISGDVAVDWHVELSRILPSPPLHFEVELDAVGGGVSVLGVIEATVLHRCHRCLTEWTEELTHHVAQALTTDADGDYPLRGDSYDFEDMFRDELMLSLPIAPLCSPECPGLVVGDGNDLNTDLSEEEAATNSPFSVLKDLLDSGD